MTEKSELKPAVRKAKRTLQQTAQEKSEAVLSLWTERRKPAEVCREMGISWATLCQWEDRALKGMLQALEPRKNLEKGPLLSPRLQALLLKKANPPLGQVEKLKERLCRVQQGKPEKSKQEKEA